MINRNGTVVALSAMLLALAACGDTTARDEGDAVTSSDVASLPIPATNENEAIADTVVDSVRRLPDTDRFMSALTASGVGETLTGKGPFTVLVPSDSAFDMLPNGALETLLSPESKATLAGIVNYHVIRGALNYSDLQALIKKGGGIATLKTASGSDLTAKADDDMITLTDVTGKVATIGVSDIAAGNGNVLMIDKLLMPGPG